jgi:hypothetical protein
MKLSQIGVAKSINLDRARRQAKAQVAAQTPARSSIPRMAENQDYRDSLDETLVQRAPLQATPQPVQPTVTPQSVPPGDPAQAQQQAQQTQQPAVQTRPAQLRLPKLARPAPSAPKTQPQICANRRPMSN